MRFVVACLLAIALSACEQLPPSFQRTEVDELLHTPSGVRFPPQIGELSRQDHKTTDYYGTGNNVSAHYWHNYAWSDDFFRLRNHPNDNATVYVYTADSEPDARGAATLEQINANTLRGIAAMHQATWRNPHTMPITLNVNGAPVTGYYNQFVIDVPTTTYLYGEMLTYTAVDPVIGEMYLFQLGSWLVKFRFTSRAEKPAEMVARNHAFVQTFLTHNGVR